MNAVGQGKSILFLLLFDESKLSVFVSVKISWLRFILFSVNRWLKQKGDYQPMKAQWDNTVPEVRPGI